MSIYILIATLHVFSQQGKLDIPVQNEFKSRASCVEYVDATLQAARKQFKGPVSLTILSYCEPR